MGKYVEHFREVDRSAFVLGGPALNVDMDIMETFNGTTQKGTTTTTVTLPSAGWTIEAWLEKDTGFAASPFFSNRGSGGRTYCGVSGTSVIVKDTTANPGSAAATIAGLPGTNTKFHLALIHNGTTLTAVLNGVVLGTASYTLSVDSTGTIGVGWDPVITTEYWKGGIDELRVWNVVRSVQDIADNYQRPLAGNETGLLRYWRFDTLVTTAGTENDVVGGSTNALTMAATRAHRASVSRPSITRWMPSWRAMAGSSSGYESFTSYAGGASSDIRYDPVLNGGRSQYAYTKAVRTAQCVLTANQIQLQRMLSVEGDANRGNANVLGCWSVTTHSPDYMPMGVAARGSENAVGDGSEYGYFAVLFPGDNKLRLYRKVNGTTTQLGSDYAITITENVDWYLRLDVQGDATVRCRAWHSDPYAEPTTWQISVSDASSGVPTTGGWIGFVGYMPSSGSAVLAYIRYAAWLSVGTGGETAPVPKSYWDLCDALQSGEKPIILAEVGVLGQRNGLAAKDAVVYMATAPFISRPGDNPGGVCYDDVISTPPTLTHTASEAFTGSSVMTVGDMTTTNESGCRDAWLTWNWDGRNIKMLIGFQHWAKWDFYPYFEGVVESVVAPEPASIQFKLRDKRRIANRQVVLADIGGSTINAARPRPRITGNVFNITPPLYDSAALKYMISGDAIGNGVVAAYNSACVQNVRENGADISVSRTVGAVDAGTETITDTLGTDTYLVDSQVVFLTGTPPSPLSLNVIYYIKTAPGSGQFTLAATRGGSTINLTTTTTGATFSVRPYYSDFSVAPSYLKLLAQPTGTITCDVVGSGNYVYYSGDEFWFATALLQSDTGLLPCLDTSARGYASNAGTDKVGKWIYERDNLVDVMDDIWSSSGCMWWFDQKGAWRAVQFDLPPVAHEFELLEDDIDYNTFRLERLILPQSVEQLGYAKNYTKQTSGLAGSVTPANAALYAADATFTAVSPSYSGLDKPSNHLLAGVPRPRVTAIYDATAAATEATRIATMRGKAIGVFSMRPRIYQHAFQLGHRLKLTHSRYGFSAGKRGIIVKTAFDPKMGRATISIAVQIDGAWPTVPSNGVVPETYFYA